MGAGDGLIANSTAFGNVLGGGNSVLGGFIGALSFENGAGVILASAGRRDQSPAPAPTASSAGSPA